MPSASERRSDIILFLNFMPAKIGIRLCSLARTRYMLSFHGHPRCGSGRASSAMLAKLENEKGLAIDIMGHL